MSLHLTVEATGLLSRISFSTIFHVFKTFKTFGIDVITDFTVFPGGSLGNPLGRFYVHLKQSPRGLQSPPTFLSQAFVVSPCPAEKWELCSDRPCPSRCDHTTWQNSPLLPPDSGALDAPRMSIKLVVPTSGLQIDHIP